MNTIRIAYYVSLAAVNSISPYHYGYAVGSHMSRYGIYPRTTETDPVWSSERALDALADLNTTLYALRAERN